LESYGNEKKAGEKEEKWRFLPGVTWADLTPVTARENLNEKLFGGR